MVPVRKQEMVDRSYYKTDYVTETAQREEVYQSCVPSSKLSIRRNKLWCLARSPRRSTKRNKSLLPRTVTETQYQTQQYLTYSPVTTYQTATVDAGGYVAQNYFAPGASRYRLGFLPVVQPLTLPRECRFIIVRNLDGYPRKLPGLRILPPIINPIHSKLLFLRLR